MAEYDNTTHGSGDTDAVITAPASTDAPIAASDTSAKADAVAAISADVDAMATIPLPRAAEQLALPLPTSSVMPQPPSTWTPSLKAPHVPDIQPIFRSISKLARAQVMQPMGITKLEFGRLLRSRPEQVLLATDNDGVHTLHSQGWLRAGAVVHVSGWSPTGRVWHAHIRRTRSGRLICR